MNRSLPQTLFAVASLSLAGCLTHVSPDPNSRHLDLEWADGFEAARAIAAESARPILLILVAGEIRERC